MKKSLLLFSFLTFFNIFQHILSQEFKKFSGERDKYIDELSLFMKVNISIEDEQILNEFINTWSTDSLYTSDEQERIIKISQKLLNKKAKAIPHFKNYLLYLSIIDDQ